MALGMPVTRDDLNYKAATSIVKLRKAFGEIESVARFLAYHPNSGAPADDPLIAMFGYTEGEAYTLRIVMEQFDAKRVDLANNFDISRQITNLLTEA